LRLHAQGRARFLAASNASATVDLNGLRGKSNRRIDPRECYRDLEKAGLRYGPTFRTIRRIRADVGPSGESYLLVSLRSATVAHDDDQLGYLDSGVLDGALHSAIALIPRPSPNIGPPVPFELDELTIHAKVPTRSIAYVRLRRPDHSETKKLDIDVCDRKGRVCLQFRGLILRVRQQDAGGGSHLVPKWKKDGSEPGPVWPARGCSVLVIGADAEHSEWLRSQYPHHVTLDPADGKAFATLGERGSHYDHIFWVTPRVRVSDIKAESQITEQLHGSITGFRLIKALLAQGYGDRPLGMTVITWQTCRVLSDEVNQPTHAAIHGLLGSVAQEYEHWSIRLLDLPLEHGCLDEQSLRRSAAPTGNAAACRNGEWYFEHWDQLDKYHIDEHDPDAPHRLRRHGVYAVLGGAGEVGEALSEYLVREYAAKVVWVGRRSLDEVIAAKRTRVGNLGRAPDYISADVRDRAQLERARADIYGMHGRLDGLINCVSVLEDRSLASLSEDGFTAALLPKIETSVRIAQVFQADPLDFVLFCSSFGSVTKPPGQSNYAAGCTFSDAFAVRLASDWPVTVKIMNWGYWGHTGPAATNASRSRMRRLGVGSIEPAAAMRAMEALLQVSAVQTGFVRWSGTTVRMREAGAEAPQQQAPHLHKRLVLALKSVASGVLKIAPTELDDHVRLEEYGLDSILVTRCAQVLREHFSALPGATLFDHPTLESLANHLRETYPAEVDRWVGLQRPAGRESRIGKGSKPVRKRVRRHVNRRATSLNRGMEMLERFKRGELSMEEVERLLDEEQIA
jgi:NAD(P)-dependent dehydrogenase (short-subunit alcohol dehydrogenase family)/aryl carrier-like protein